MIDRTNDLRLACPRCRSSIRGMERAKGRGLVSHGRRVPPDRCGKTICHAQQGRLGSEVLRALCRNRFRSIDTQLQTKVGAFYYHYSRKAVQHTDTLTHTTTARAEQRLSFQRFFAS